MENYGGKYSRVEDSLNISIWKPMYTMEGKATGPNQISRNNTKQNFKHTFLFLFLQNSETFSLNFILFPQNPHNT